MGMMKRSRVEELSFSSRAGGVVGGSASSNTTATSVPVPVTAPAGHHRLLTQHASLQYQVNTTPSSGVLKNSNTAENIVAVTVATSMPTQSTVQYTGMF